MQTMTKHIALSIFLLLRSQGTSAQQNLRRRDQEIDSFTGVDGIRGPENDPPVDVLEALYADKVFKTPGTTSTCETYSMSFYNRNYNTPEIQRVIPFFGGGDSAQWGMHALQWKGECCTIRTIVKGRLITGGKEPYISLLRTVSIAFIQHSFCT